MPAGTACGTTSSVVSCNFVALAPGVEALNPQWSPDGRLVALRMKRGDGWQVWRWKPEGGEPVQITHCPRDVQSFRWSADGSRIVFEVYRPHDEKVVRGIAEEGALFDQDFQSPWDINMPLVEQKLGSSTFRVGQETAADTGEIPSSIPGPATSVNCRISSSAP